ncbi:hypothetical protein CI1B_27600 [Bradyrhizobium ivorense]|uniref:Uncharacterized protein n=1 Tax=Bradyrhizobium ivorense TaxID=2511166 RepID=A0A508T6X1_9BRAD|nr:hypothetical protein [Bradyrhizobium ivorense]VIO69554.1 hypothetical protein CI1B_27600 [Bradyrhizobium ivorense]VIO71300.1 hypothetical protein CI41S_29710 [Bradyrhizobium ivorense]
MLDSALEKIETGEVSAREARATISALLKEGSEKGLERLYAALGAWLWNSLEGRRRDGELREWFDILRRTSATLAPKNAAYAERFRAFYDLLQMSINTSKVIRPSEVMHRQHVVPILKLLRDAPTHQLEKMAIARKLDLRDANLSRVLHLMTNARLVERTTEGKFAQFALTREGRLALEKREAKEHDKQRLVALTPREILPTIAHPAHGAGGADLYVRAFVDAIQGPGHGSGTLGLLSAGDQVGFRRAVEEWLQHLHGPSPAVPGYMKVRAKSSYHGSMVVIVPTKKTDMQGYIPIETDTSKSTSFPAGMLQLHEEETDHAE